MANTTRETKTFLTAEDKTAGAFASMRREMESTQKRVLEMQAAMAGVAGLLVGGAFAIAMKKAIDDMAAFKDMAIDAGVQGAANIQQFERAFRMANVPMADAVSIMQKLSKSSLEVKDPASNAALAIRALGLSAEAYAKMKPDEMLIAVAQASAQFAPSAKKNAVMMELMGKSGASMQRVLAEIAQTTPEVSEFMNAQAEAADALQDKYTGMQMKAESFGRAGASVLVPTLSNILDGFIELKGQKDGSLGFFEAVGNAMKIVAGSAAALWIGVKELGDAFGAFFAKMGQSNEAIEAIEKAREERRAANISQLSEMFANLGKVETAATSAAEAAGKIKFDPAAAKAAREAAADYQKLMQAIGVKISAVKEEVDFNRKLTDAEKMLLDLQTGKYDKLSAEQRESLKGKAEELAALERELQLRKNLLANLQAQADFRSEYQDAIAANLTAATSMITSLRDGNAQLAIEVENLGATDAARQLALLSLEKEIALRAILDDGQRANIEGLYQNRKALLETKAAFEQQKSTFSSVFDSLEGGFKAALQGAKSFGDYIKNGLKNALYELVARPFIIQLAASLTGASGQVVAGALGGANVAGGAGGFGSLFSGGGALGSIGAFGSAFGNGATFGSSVGLGGTFANLGAGGGSLGFQAGSVMGAAGPYIAAALAAYQLYQTFRDKGENPKYRLGFGSAAQGYASDSVFGRQGFVYAQGNDAANQGFRNFQTGLGGIDTQIGRLMSPDQIAAATSRLNGTQGREFSFPKDDPTASEQLSLEYLKLKYSAVFADFNAGISGAIRNFSGTSEDLIKYIGTQVVAYEQLRAMIDQVNSQLEGLNNSGLDALNKTLQDLRDNIDSARAAFLAAKAANDPTKEVEAQKALMTAIMARYNTERELINQISAQLDSVQSSRYDFGQQMSSRFQSVGGAGTGSVPQIQRMDRLTTQANAATDPAARIGYINAALSVADQYVATEQAAIRARFEALSRAQQVSVDLQRRAIDERQAGLQRELDLIGDMKGIAESARQAIRSITFSGANPLSAFGRFDVQGQDVASLQAQFRSSTGGARSSAANSLIQAIQGRLTSAGDLYQRPSDEYLNAYNEAMAALSEVQSAAQSEAERALALQASIEQLAIDSNTLTQSLVDYAAQMQAEVDAFNATALPIYQRLAEQGDAAYGALAAQSSAQLDAVTRGLSIAEAQRQLLVEVRNQLVLLNSPTATIGNNRKNGSDGGTGTTTTTVVVQIGNQQFDAALITSVGNNRRVIGQMLENSV